MEAAVPPTLLVQAAHIGSEATALCGVLSQWACVRLLPPADHAHTLSVVCNSTRVGYVVLAACLALADPAAAVRVAVERITRFSAAFVVHAFVLVAPNDVRSSLGLWRALCSAAPLACSIVPVSSVDGLGAWVRATYTCARQRVQPADFAPSDAQLTRAALLDAPMLAPDEVDRVVAVCGERLVHVHARADTHTLVNAVCLPADRATAFREWLSRALKAGEPGAVAVDEE